MKNRRGKLVRRRGDERGYINRVLGGLLGLGLCEVGRWSGLCEVGSVKLIMRFSLLLAAAAVEAAVISRDACDAPTPDADGRYTISAAGIKAQVCIAISRSLQRRPVEYAS